MDAREYFKGYWDTCSAIHDALCLGLVELAEALRAERDRMASHLADER